MGRRRKWFLVFKSCLTGNCNAEKSQDYKTKLKLESGTANQFDPIVLAKDEVRDQDGAQLPPPPSKEIKPPLALEAKLPLNQENEQSKHAYSVALASAVAAQAAVEVVRLSAAARVPGKLKEETATIKIQTAFRAYQARKVLQSLRRLERLKKLIEGNAVKRQTANTLHLMQTLSRLQSQIQARRTRMKEENQALQRQLQLKHERELEKLKIGAEWDDSMQSKEQIEARIVNKHEAAIRRERALAYAFSHQWKASSRAVTPMFTDANNPEWGWSWLERWISTRPWENRVTNSTNHASTKSTGRSSGAETQKVIMNIDFDLERTPVSSAQKPVRPPSHQSPSTASSKPSSSTGRKRLVYPRGAFGSTEEDSRSMASLRSDNRPRRHSIGGPSLRDDDSVASSPSVHSYMASTESARAKSRFHTDEAESQDNVYIGPVKKRLSFTVADNQNTPLATARRHSDPPKIDSSSTKYSLHIDKMADRETTR